MELTTFGRDIRPGTRVLIHCRDGEILSEMPDTGDRYCLFLAESGSGILNYGGRRTMFNAPVLFCLNETDIPVFENSCGLVLKTLYFHPNVVNSIFNFQNIRESCEFFSASEINDRISLMPFHTRTHSYYGMIELEAGAAKKVSKLMKVLNDELMKQQDYYWPSRSRSYLLELLFVIERLFMVSENVEDIIFTGEQQIVDRIILYMHLNYNEKITLSVLSKEFDMPRAALKKSFLERSGMPVMTYLVKLRIKLACTILRDTMIPVAEVMDRIGFKDNARFSRMFRKYTGFSPAEYRLNYCWLLN